MLVLVMGMGRSGTSLLMQILHAAGFDCGSDWISANENNPRGYYELRNVMSHNIALLQQLCGTKDALFMIPSMESVDNWVGIDLPIRFPHHDFAVKDPRFSLTFPIWQAHLKNYDLRIILARRNEEANAESLARAYHIDLVSARTLIGEYNRRAEYYIDRYRLPSVSIQYEDWFHDRDQNIALLEGLLERPLDLNWTILLEPTLVHCQGHVAKHPLNDLNRQPGYVSLGDIQSDAYKENFYALEKIDSALANELTVRLQDRNLQISVTEEGNYTFRHGSVDNETSGAQTTPSLQEWQFPKTFQGEAIPYNRYSEFQPKQHDLILLGIDALALPCLSPRLTQDIERLCIIEPDNERLLSYLMIYPIQSFLLVPQVHLFGGEQAFDQALDFILQSPAMRKKPFPVAHPVFMQRHAVQLQRFMKQFQEITRSRSGIQPSL